MSELQGPQFGGRCAPQEEQIDVRITVDWPPIWCAVGSLNMGFVVVEFSLLGFLHDCPPRILYPRKTTERCGVCLSCLLDGLPDIIWYGEGFPTMLFGMRH